MISDVLDALVAVESALTITSPIDAAVTKVYKYLLAPEMELPGPRCWMNEWTMDPVDFKQQMSLRELMFTIRLQFIAAPSTGDVQRSYDIATRFWEGLIDAIYPLHSTPELFRDSMSLGGSCTRSVLRGANPTVGLIPRAGKTFVGAEGYLDIYMSEFLGE